jgi:PAS domain-containing protein
VERRTADGGLVSVCEDITDLKAREASLRLMFEGSPVPMWIWSKADDRFLDLNEAAVIHYGWDRETYLA